MARFFTTNELEYMATLLSGSLSLFETGASMFKFSDEAMEQIPLLRHLSIIGSLEDEAEDSIFVPLEEQVDDALMEIFGYGLQDMRSYAVDNRKGALHSPPWLAMEMPYRGDSRAELAERGFPDFGPMLSDFINPSA